MNLEGMVINDIDFAARKLADNQCSACSAALERNS